MSDPNTTVSLVTASKASALAGAMDDGEQNTEQSLMPEVSASTATVPLPTASSDRESRSEEERYPPTRCQRKRGSGICTSDHTGKVVDGRYYCDKCYELATRSTDSSSQLASAKSKLKAEKLKADKLSKDLKAAQRALAKLKVRADSDEPSEEEKRAKKSRRSARVEAAAAVKSSPKKVIRKGHGKYEVKDSSSSESAKDSSDFSRKSPKKKSKASKHLKKAKSTKKVTFQDRTNNKKKSAQKKTIAREKQEYRELKATLDAQQDEVERLQDKPQPSSPKKRRKRSARIHRAEKTRDKLSQQLLATRHYKRRRGQDWSTSESSGASSASSTTTSATSSEEEEAAERHRRGRSRRRRGEPAQSASSRRQRHRQQRASSESSSPSASPPRAAAGANGRSGRGRKHSTTTKRRKWSPSSGSASSGDSEQERRRSSKRTTSAGKALLREGQKQGGGEWNVRPDGVTVTKQVRLDLGIFAQQDGDDLEKRCHLVPFETLEESSMTAIRDEVKWLVSKAGGSDDSEEEIKPYRKQWRPKLFPSLPAFILAWNKLTMKVMLNSPPEFLNYRLEGMLMFSAWVTMRFSKRSWDSVSVDIAVAMHLWKKADLLMSKRCQEVIETVSTQPCMENLKIGTDPFTPRGEHSKWPAYDKALTPCPTCKGKGWKKDWCPACNPSLPGAMKALAVRNKKRKEG